MENKETKYTITVSRHQLDLIANCVEDCHRFASGQMELHHTTCMCPDMHDLHHALGQLQPLMTPGLTRGASYDWAGNHCPNEYQRKFIAETYYIYREITHQLTIQHPHNECNVYDGPTLTCDHSGPAITVRKLNSDRVKLTENMLTDNGFISSDIDVSLRIYKKVLYLDPQRKHQTGKRVIRVEYIDTISGNTLIQAFVRGMNRNFTGNIQYVDELLSAFRVCGLDSLADSFKVRES